jgi:3-oxoacyl-[acyl-carrier protein] reductase
MDSSRVAIVTGAGGGIGSHVVQRLLARGYRVAALDREQAHLLRLFGRVPHTPALSSAVVDVADPQLVRECVSETVERWGRLDTLVTCAGMFAQTPISNIDANTMRGLLASNLESVIHLSSAAMHAMARARSGRMVHVSSIAAESGSAVASVYAASKAGVVALVKSHARELAPLGISVNAVLPGYCATPMLDPMSAFVERFIVPRIALKRIAEPDEIAEVVEFLVTCKTNYLTGSAIIVDGGLHVG